MFDLLWDLHQQRRIGELESKLDRTQRPQEGAAEALRLLEARIDKLTLVSMALWTLLKENTKLTEEDLLEKIKEIDLSDGKLDGKVRQNVSDCPQCGRVMSQKHRRCLYCGFEMNRPDSAFDELTR